MVLGVKRTHNGYEMASLDVENSPAAAREQFTHKSRVRRIPVQFIEPETAPVEQTEELTPVYMHNFSYGGGVAGSFVPQTANYSDSLLSNLFNTLSAAAGSFARSISSLRLGAGIALASVRKYLPHKKYTLSDGMVREWPYKIGLPASFSLPGLAFLKKLSLPRYNKVVGATAVAVVISLTLGVYGALQPTQSNRPAVSVTNGSAASSVTSDGGSSSTAATGSSAQPGEVGTGGLAGNSGSNRAWAAPSTSNWCPPHASSTTAASAPASSGSTTTAPPAQSGGGGGSETAPQPPASSTTVMDTVDNTVSNLTQAAGGAVGGLGI